MSEHIVTNSVLVKLVDESCLDDLGLLRGSCSTDGLLRSSINRVTWAMRMLLRCSIAVRATAWRTHGCGLLRMARIHWNFSLCYGRGRKDRYRLG